MSIVPQDAGADRYPDASVDPWGQAVADFLADLLDGVEGRVHTDGAPDDPGAEDRIPVTATVGADGRARQFSFRTTGNAGGVYGSDTSFPDELADLPAGALRALARVTRSASAAGVVYPSVAKALHDVIIAEVLADRLARRVEFPMELDDVAGLVAETLDYVGELALTRLEGGTVGHGVVVAGDALGHRPLDPTIAYPGWLPTRKRTPLLFDGSETVLVVSTAGHAMDVVSRHTLPALAAGSEGFFDEFPGLDGALTAAASIAFRGIGVYLRPDRSIWIFDEGTPLFVRRTTRWKSIAMDSFTRALAVLGATSSYEVASAVARAALSMSMEGYGGVFAIASDPEDLDGLVQKKDRHPSAGRLAGAEADDDLHRLVSVIPLARSRTLARLARLDGATIVDPSGALLAYGAIVTSSDSRGEGARTAAARALSQQLGVALSVSQDGPITLFHKGEIALEVL